MSERRKIFGEKILDLGNYTVVALIFGQLALERKDTSLVILGMSIALLTWVTGFWFLQKGGKRK